MVTHLIWNKKFSLLWEVPTHGYLLSHAFPVYRSPQQMCSYLQSFVFYSLLSQTLAGGHGEQVMSPQTRTTLAKQWLKVEENAKVGSAFGPACPGFALMHRTDLACMKSNVC